jgi:hypothetical protein
MATTTQDNRYLLRGLPVRVIKPHNVFDATIESFSVDTGLLTVNRGYGIYRSYYVERMTFGLGGASGIEHIRFAYVV